MYIWEFPKSGGTLSGVLVIRILLFRVLYYGPLFLETPIYIYIYVYTPSTLYSKKPVLIIRAGFGALLGAAFWVG